MKKTKPSYKLYILMRNDLPSMNAGKAMAQAAHASNSLVGEWGDRQEVKDWQKEGGFFGTTIVLAANKDTICHVLKRAAMRDIPPPFGPVYDTTYPFNTTTEIAALIPRNRLSAPAIVKEDNRVVLFRRELTCGYVFVADGSSDKADLVGDLPLHP